MIKKRTKGGFTLIELLTVIAIIGILAGIIIPSVQGIKVSANKAKTKVQFTGWANGITQFKHDYGFYPTFTTAASATDAGVNLGTDTAARDSFIRILNGKALDGTALSGTELAQNKRRLQYYSFGPNDLGVGGDLVDAFGNKEIYIAIDYNYDGVIRDSGVLGAVKTEGGADLVPTLPADGIRAGVIFYSPGRGDNVSDLVTSW